MKINLLPGQYQKIIRRLYTYTGLFLGLFVLYLIAVRLNLFYLFGRMPDYREIEEPESVLASEVISEDGQILGKYYYENRSPVEFQDLSPYLINCLIATEDVRFTKHSGIDLRSMFRVAKGLLTGNRGSGGGSTISQQLAKNLFALREDTKYKGLSDSIRFRPLNMAVVKTKEWMTAIQLESRYTKEEIMTMYLNTVAFGSNAYGIRSASRTYFKKEPRDLNVEEAAVLIGMLQNPTRFNPKYHPRASKERRNVVYTQMVKYGFLSGVDFEKIKNKPIELHYQVENQNMGIAPYLIAEYKKDIKNVLDSLNKGRAEDDQYDLYTSGLKVYTSIDSRMQRYAYESMLEHMTDQQAKFGEHWRGRNPWCNDNGKEIPKFVENIMAPRCYRYIALKKVFGDDKKAILKEMSKPVPMRVFAWDGEKDVVMSPLDSIRYYLRFLHTGFMAMDPTTSYVKAWIGGVNFKHFKYDHVRQAIRQPGSTFKAFVYATAIENGYTPCDMVRDAPVSIKGTNGRMWTPKNANGRYSYGSMTLRRAWAMSVNTIAAQIMQKFGPHNIAQMAYRMGVSTPLQETPPLCLGASDVTVADMVNGYSTVVNGGKAWTHPEVIVRIEDRFGHTIYNSYPTYNQAISEETAYLMLHTMKGSIEEPAGTAAGLRRYACSQGNEIAAKTGTTSNYSDGWFMGLTHNLVGGVWVGADERSIHFRSMDLGQGARIAMPLWGKFMDKVYADPELNAIGYKKGQFKRPESVSYSLDCSSYGGYSKGDSIKVNNLNVQKPSGDGLLE
jgi:penicillin-binding protein 1A